MAKTLAEATKRPDNIGARVPDPPQPPVPAVTVREQPGLAVSSLGPAPALWTTSYDSVKQFYRPGTSQQRFSPLPSKANPAINAQAANVARTIVQASTPAAGSPGASTFVQNMPINKQTGTTYVVKAADLANLDTFSNNSGGTIVLPAAALTAGFYGNAAANSGTGASPSVTGTPFYAGAALAIISTESDLGTPNTTPTGSGWTAIDAAQNGAYASIYTRLTPSGATTSNYSIGSSLTWTGSLLFFGNCNAVPTVAQTRNIFSGGISGSTSNSAAFTNPVTSGNSILVVVTVTAVPYDAIHLDWNYSTFGVSDGVNTYVGVMALNAGSGTTDGTQQVAFLAQNVTGGSTTVTVTSNTLVGHANGGVSAVAYELNLGTGAAVPSGIPAGWYCYLQNTGTGTFTVESPVLIDGSSSSFTLGPNQGTIVAFDGTNWFTERGIGGSSITLPLAVVDGGTGTSTPALIAGTNITITGAWPDQTINASGSASVPAGTPVIVPPPRNASDNSFGNQSIVFKIAQEMIQCYPTKFKVSLLLQSGSSWVMTAGVILRTAYTSTSSLAGVGGLVVIDSTPITWGGSATPTLGGGENISDDISLTLDTTHDYWFVAHFSSTSGLIYISNAANMVQNNNIGARYYGYVSGDHTADTTMPPTLTTSSSYPVEVLLWRVIAG